MKYYQCFPFCCFVLTSSNKRSKIKMSMLCCPRSNDITDVKVQIFLLTDNSLRALIKEDYFPIITKKQIDLFAKCTVMLQHISFKITKTLYQIKDIQRKMAFKPVSFFLYIINRSNKFWMIKVLYLYNTNSKLIHYNTLNYNLFLTQLPQINPRNVFIIRHKLIWMTMKF